MGSALLCLELLGTEADLHRVKFHVFADGEEQLGTGCITEALQQIKVGLAPPPSRRAMADCVVPMRAASSFWVNPARLRRS